MADLRITFNDGDPYPIHSGASPTLGFDFGPWTPSGGTVTAGTCSLFDLTGGTAYPSGLSGAASASGGTVTQKFTALPAGHVLRCDIKITLNSGDTDVGELFLVVPA